MRVLQLDTSNYCQNYLEILSSFFRKITFLKGFTISFIFHDTPTLDGFAYKEKTVKTDRSEI